MRASKQRRIWTAVIAIIAMVFGLGVLQTTTSTETASAAVGSAFNPGNIISDAKFHDSAAMSAAQVQGFLDSRVPNCGPGFVCLKDYRQDTWTRGADAQCASYLGSAAERASSIISKVATACGINPQVLLVLLQKEQTLITSIAPSAARYNFATGYACPDTAPCSTEFAGFYNQIYKAAWQYRYYENHPSSYRYRAGTVVNIQWHPNAACGTQPVYIENQATANLYIYTPYAPNAAALNNLYGVGDVCSSYGNRNFWRIFTDWFGAPNGPRNPHGSLDFAVGVLSGIQITGWAVDPYIKASSFVWVDVDGSGAPLRVDRPLSWIEARYPGYGPNHGFDTIVPTSPGAHSVCVSQTNGISLGCRNVVVPARSRAAGYVDTVSTTAGTILVSGWSLDKSSPDPTYVWINVDGVGRAYKVDRDLPWTGNAYPGTGIRHGFSVSIPTQPGSRQVCVYGVDSVLLRCLSTVVPSNEVGAFETATGVIGGIKVGGYSLDQRTSTPSYVWVTVDGAGHPLKANAPSPSAANAYPAVLGQHGFSSVIPATPGPHSVCIAGTTENRSYGCKSVTVPNNEVGHVDSVTAVIGSISVSGWSLDQTKPESTYVWVTIDGRGSPVRASLPLAWIDGLYPGVGPNHGFAATFPATAGPHVVCVTGTKENVSLGCTNLVVPSAAVASVDTVSGVTGGVQVTGWAVDRESTKTMYIWVDLDGIGSAVKADRPLSWIDGYFPGVGDNHGFDRMIPTSSGPHRVCLTLTENNAPLGCSTVTVP